MSVNKCVFAALLLAGGAAYGQTVKSGDEQAFISELSALRCGISTGKEIWPGYKIGGFAPLTVYLPKSRITVLFTEAEPIPGFKAAYGALSHYTCGKGDPGVYSKAGRFGRAERNFSWEKTGGREIFTFNLETCEGRSVSQLRLLAHEYFHLFQKSWRSRSAEQAAEPYYGSISAGSYAWMLIEDLLLAKAVMADDNELASIAREFIRVRKHRWANEPAALVAWDKQQEVTEGTALYADMQADQASKGLALAWTVSRGPEAAQRALDGLGKIGTGFIRQRYYPGGAAQGIILDRLGISWKQRVSQGETLSEVLEDALSFGWIPAPGFYLERKYGFSHLKTFAEQEMSVWAKPEDLALQDFRLKKGQRLVIESPFLLEAAIYGPMPIKVTGKKSAYKDEYYRGADIFEANRHGEFEILVKNVDLLSGYTGETVKLGKFDWDMKFAEFVFPPDDPIRFVIDGAKIDKLAVGERSFKKLVIESGRARIRVHNGGRLSADGVKLILTVPSLVP